MVKWLRNFLFLTLLFPGFVEAATRYVSTTGSGSACTVISTPCTLSVAFGQMSGGDTTYLRAGTYTTYLNGDTFNWPSGSIGAPTTIAGYPNETVIIRPASESIINLSSSTFGAKTYITFRNLILDGAIMDLGTQVVGTNGAQTHIEFDSVTIRNAVDNNAFSVCVTCTDWWIHHSTIDGPGGGYGIYQSGSGIIFEYNTISNCDAYAIHNFHQTAADASDNIYRYNTITNCGGSVQFSAGAILARGSNVQFYGNLLYNNQKGGVIVDDCTDCTVYNNTIYGSDLGGGGYNGIQVGNAQTAVRPIIQNNIIVKTTGVGANFGLVSSTSPTHDHNLCEAAGTWCDSTQAASSIFATPGSDFRLKIGSLAIDGGTNLATVFTIDLVGTTRPQGSAFDIGAYEFSSATCTAPSPALVASFGFDSVATNSAGSGVGNATLGAGVTYTTGKYGQGLLMPGTAGVTVADHNALDFCNGFTLEAWISVPSVSSDSMFIVKNPGSKYFLGQLAGYCDAATMPMGGFSQTTLVDACQATALTTSTMTHLAVTYNGTTVTLYKNASSVATDTGGALLDATTGTLQFCDSGFSEFCPSGTIIDEVRLYNYARSGAEILADSVTPIGVPTAPTGFKLK